MKFFKGLDSMSDKAKTYWTVFSSAFYISAVTFGSGYVIISVIKKRFVDDLKWIDEDEMIDLMALAQSAPGMVTANTAQLVGYRICGAMGAFLAVLGVSLPPLGTIFVISLFYDALRDNPVVSAVLKGMQAGACAVICDVVTNLFLNVVKDKKRIVLKIAIMATAFVAGFVFDVNFILIVLFALLLSVIWYFINRKGRKVAR